jgi:hypothetical protein
MLILVSRLNIRVGQESHICITKERHYLTILTQVYSDSIYRTYHLAFWLLSTYDGSARNGSCVITIIGYRPPG